MVSEQGVWILAVPRQWVGVYQRGGQLGDCVHGRVLGADRHLVRVPDAELTVDHDRDLRVKMVTDPPHSQAAHVDDPVRAAQRGLGCLQQGRVHGVQQPPEHLPGRILEQ